MKHILPLLAAILFGLTAHAQIGYQVALLDPTTGEPRINEVVSVTIDITNSEGAIIISDSQTATSNEFGILSLQIGKADSFAVMDWSKLPLWVSATVNGTVIGKSQILNVPVAEYAKTTGGVLTKEILSSKRWKRGGNGSFELSFNDNGHGSFIEYGSSFTYTEPFSFEICGNTVLIAFDESTSGAQLYYSISTNRLYGTVSGCDSYWE